MAEFDSHLGRAAEPLHTGLAACLRRECPPGRAVGAVECGKAHRIARDRWRTCCFRPSDTSLRHSLLTIVDALMLQNARHAHEQSIHKSAGTANSLLVGRRA